MQNYHHLTASKRGEIQTFKINSRPRAKLNFQSPKLVFYKEINKFALVT